MLTRSFPAMGTTIRVLLDAPPSAASDAALERAAGVFERIERTCSRFDETSELSRLNREGGASVSPLLAEIIRLALDGRARTSGLFDPTVLDAVVAAGYDRTFAEIGTAPARAAAAAGGRVRLVGNRVELGPGVRIDLGGIAKGFAADRACEELAPYGPCLVDAGGDIAVSGSWVVQVDGGPALELIDGAVATSGRDRRRWRREDGPAHHLIDPATGSPAVTSTLRATVVAKTAAEAEVLAKAAFLGGRPAVPNVLVLDDGRTVLGGGLAA